MSFRGDGSQLTGIVANKIFQGDTEVECVDTGTGGIVKFTTDNNERARITGVGTFIFGKTTQGYTNNSEAQFDVHTTNGYINISKSTDGNYGGLRIMRNNTSDIGGYLGIAGSGGHFCTQATQHDIILRSENKLLLRSNGGGDALKQ